jgi:hypothetical protein
MTFDRNNERSQHRRLHSVEATLQIKVLLARFCVENDPKVMPDPLLQCIEDSFAMTVRLKVRMNGKIADDGAIDFVPECAAGTDKPAAMNRESRVLAVSEGFDDVLRRTPSQRGRLKKRGQLMIIVEG